MQWWAYWQYQSSNTKFKFKQSGALLWKLSFYICLGLVTDFSSSLVHVAFSFEKKNSSEGWDLHQKSKIIFCLKAEINNVSKYDNYSYYFLCEEILCWLEQ